MPREFDPLPHEHLSAEEAASLDQGRILMEIHAAKRVVTQLGNLRKDALYKLCDAKKARRNLKTPQSHDAYDDAKCDYDVIYGRIQAVKTYLSSLQTIYNGP